MTIPYKSFCWSFGTTSFRTKNFNRTIELQLSLLDEFWSLKKNKNTNWSSNNTLQASYYDFLKSKNFVVGEALNKSKDAREKTSGLVDIGLIDSNRNLSDVGRTLLEISRKGDFSSDNFLKIPKDSFIYLKQFLKSYNPVNGEIVKPFIVTLYVLSKLEYLSIEEYKYLLPLCTNFYYTEKIINDIKLFRKSIKSIDEIIVSRLMDMPNYIEALNKFLTNNIDEDLICEIGLNRKSRQYDKEYFLLYKYLYSFYLKNDVPYLYLVYKIIKRLKIGKFWKNYIFKPYSEKKINSDILNSIKTTEFSTVKTEQEFKKVFFKYLHLFKAKATLSDYFDLNRRYMRITDILLFEDNSVKLDIIPKYFFNSVIDKLYLNAYSASDKLFTNCDLDKIDDCLILNEQNIINGINKEFGVNIKSLVDANKVLEDDRYKRFLHLIETKFTDKNLLFLLDCFEERQDETIRNIVTDNADIPTIFEYVLAIIWYKLSEYEGNILDYMKLSLDADLLPKTHAIGGDADIIYEYAKSNFYPKHCLLIEATLSDGNNQRRMEMEPVSRHLGEHLLKTKNLFSYAIFITNDLNINVISDFRSRKDTIYYDRQNFENFVNGMKIIPLQSSELKKIIKSNKKYKELYKIFDEAFISNLPPHKWYKVMLADIL